MLGGNWWLASSSTVAMKSQTKPKYSSECMIPAAGSRRRVCIHTPARKSLKRFEDFRAGVWMQTLLRDPAAGIMHSLLYFGFVWLFIATVLLEANHQFPPSMKFLHGQVYEAYSLTADIAGIAFLTGILWAIGRRYLWAPYRIWTKTKPEDAVILGVFLLIGVTGFLVEGLRLALVGP